MQQLQPKSAQYIKIDSVRQLFDRLPHTRTAMLTACSSQCPNESRHLGLSSQQIWKHSTEALPQKVFPKPNTLQSKRRPQPLITFMDIQGEQKVRLRAVLVTGKLGTPCPNLTFCLAGYP